MLTRTDGLHISKNTSLKLCGSRDENAIAVKAKEYEDRPLEMGAGRNGEMKQTTESERWKSLITERAMEVDIPQ